MNARATEPPDVLALVRDMGAALAARHVGRGDSAAPSEEDWSTFRRVVLQLPELREAFENGFASRIAQARAS